MIRTTIVLILVALGLAPPESKPSIPPADDQAATDPPPAIVLADKDLFRVGNAYVLTDQPARDAKLRVLADEVEELETRYKPLLDARKRLKDLTAVLPKASLRNQARAELRVFEAQYKADLDLYQSERARLTNGMDLLVAETRKMYETLWSDPTVKRAVRAYNHLHRPKIVLGPVAGAEEYRAVVLRDDAALLKEKGMVPEKGHRWVVEREAQVPVLAFRAHVRLEHFLSLEASVGAGTPSKLLEKRKATCDRLAKASEPLTRQLAAEVTMIDRQLHRLSPEAPGMAASWRDRADRLSEARHAFLDAVAEARRAADAAPAARRQLETDEEVLETLEEIAGKTTLTPATRAYHVAEALEYRRGLATLRDLEAAVRVDRLPLRRERDGPWLVGVTFHGTHAASAAVGHGAETTRLPSALAQAIRLVPGPESPAAVVRLPGDETLQGQLSALPSMGSTVI